MTDLTEMAPGPTGEVAHRRPRRQRFYVTEIEGYGISGWRAMLLSVSVRDSRYCRAEIQRWNQEAVAGRGITSARKRKRMRDEAAALAAELNAEDARP